jgi:hypothetical protein
VPPYSTPQIATLNAMAPTCRWRVKGGFSSPSSSRSIDCRRAYWVVVIPRARYSSMPPGGGGRGGGTVEHDGWREQHHSAIDTRNQLRLRPHHPPYSTRVATGPSTKWLTMILLQVTSEAAAVGEGCSQLQALA